MPVTHEELATVTRFPVVVCGGGYVELQLVFAFTVPFTSVVFPTVVPVALTFPLVEQFVEACPGDVYDQG
jgi:hypothetical protein